LGGLPGAVPRPLVGVGGGQNRSQNNFPSRSATALEEKAPTGPLQEPRKAFQIPQRRSPSEPQEAGSAQAAQASDPRALRELSGIPPGAFREPSGGASRAPREPSGRPSGTPPGPFTASPPWILLSKTDPIPILSHRIMTLMSGAGTEPSLIGSSDVSRMPPKSLLDAPRDPPPPGKRTAPPDKGREGIGGEIPPWSRGGPGRVPGESQSRFKFLDPLVHWYGTVSAHPPWPYRPMFGSR